MDTIVPFAILEHLTYTGIFIALSLAGYLIPLPEEAILISVGYAVSAGFSTLPKAIAISLFAVIIGNNFLYWFARTNRHFFETKQQRLKPKILEKYDNMFERHAGKAIFSTRFIPGLRFFGPFLSGGLKIRWKTFFFYNTLASIIYAPIFIFLGYHFHNGLASIILRVRSIQHLVFTVIIISLSLFAAIMIKNRVYKKDDNNAENGPPTDLRI